MFTTCTHCHTRFRIGAAQLKAAEGQVRCGKCGQAFDAFEHLEDRAEPLDQVSAPSAMDTPLSVDYTPAPGLGATDEPSTEEPVLTAGPRKPKFPPIDDLFGDLGHGPEHTAPDEIEMPLGADMPDIVVNTAPAATDMPEMDANAEAGPEAHVEAPLAYAIHAEDLPQHPTPRPRRPAVSALWWSGITLMALVLGLQLVNADRTALARNPVIGPSLQALYADLGRPLPPPVSVNAWAVSGLNVTSDPQEPGVLSITGTLANQAEFVQPWPFLRVQLTDRFGQPLRGRDFKPADYLPPTEAGTLLAAGQASRFRIDVVDPGADAVGFTLSPCLDLATRRVCATSERE